MAPAIILEIHPCIDSLLYAPVYLAILSMFAEGGEKAHFTSPDGVLQLNIPSGKPNDPQVTVRLCLPGNGDNETIERLNARSDTNVLKLAICDPLTAIEQVELQQRNMTSCLVDDLRIVGILIDRIPLCIVCRNPSKRWRTADTSLEAKRDMKLVALFREINESAVNDRDKLKDACDELRVDYWGKGNTSKFLARRFLGADGNPPELPNEDDIEEECRVQLERLAKNEADVIVSHAHWLIAKLTKNNKKYSAFKVFTRQVFPSVPFPFTGIVTTKQFADRNLRLDKPIFQTFIEHMEAAVAFVHREPSLAEELLRSYSGKFRHYGMNRGTVSSGVITSALHQFLIDGCFAGTATFPPVGWYSALLLKSPDTTEVGRYWNALFESLSKSDGSSQVPDWSAAMNSMGLRTKALVTLV